MTVLLLLACAQPDAAVETERECVASAPFVGDVLLEGESAREDAARFCAEYDSVEGSFQVKNVDWQDLSPISCLCSVSEEFVVASMPSLHDLSGLRLSYVGEALVLLNVESIVDLSGLPPDLEAGGLELLGNDALQTTDPFRLPPWADHAIELSLNPQLADLLAWSEVESVRRIYLDLPLVEDLQGLNSLREIQGSAYFTDCGLRSFDGLDSLEDGYLSVVGCRDFESVAGLPAGVALRGLVVDGAPDLTSLQGIPDHATIALLASFETGITSLAGLELAREVGALQIGECDALTSVAGFPADAGAVEEIYLHGLPALATIEGLAGVTSVDGELNLNDLPALRSLEGLHSIASIGEVWVKDLTAVEDVDGLRGLRTVGGFEGGDFTFNGMDALRDLQGLHGVESVQGAMDVLGGGIPESECDALLEAIGAENIGGNYYCG